MITYLIYGTDKCRWCDMAKDFLAQRGEVHVSININENPGAKAYVKSQGHKTVPQVYIESPEGREHIGGFEALVEYLGN